MAALKIKNIPTGPGDDIKVDASYAKGATKNVIATSGSSPSFAMFGDSGFAYQSVGFGATTDGVYLPGAAGTGGIAPDRRPGVSAARSTTTGIRTGRRACSAATPPSGMTAAPTTTCSVREPPRPRAPIARPSQPATRARHWSAVLPAPIPAIPTSTSRSSASITRWTPVKNLTFSAEVQWFHLDQKMSGSSAFTRDRSEAGRPSTSSRIRTRSCCRFALSVTSDRTFLPDLIGPLSQRGGHFFVYGFRSCCRSSG